MTTAPEIPNPQIENQYSKIKNPRPRRPRLSPTSLLDFLHQNPSASLNALTAHFHCSLDKLSRLLNNPEFLQRHKLQTQLAFLQSRLAAHNSLPGALAKTITLMHEAEKPEVARRAAAALIQIAGLPIRTAAQPAPAPLPEPPPPPEPQLSDKQLDKAMHAIQFLDTLKEEGIDLNQIEYKYSNAFMKHILQFLDDHNIPYDKSHFDD